MAAKNPITAWAIKAPELQAAFVDGLKEGQRIKRRRKPPALQEEHDAAIAAKEREKVQPFIDLARVLATKCDEMQDLMRRNKIVIDNVQEPMQKLAFTFYSEIAELAHKAEVVIEEYEESLREGAGKPDKGR